MMLPLPTVSNIDVDAERLKDIETRRNRATPDIAAATRDAISVGSAVQKVEAENDARTQAQWFQKEYVDKGWEGYQKAWQEAGSPKQADPRFVRAAVGDTPLKAFELLGKITEQEKSKAAVTAYEEGVRAGLPAEELSALAIAAGKASGEGLKAINTERERADKKVEKADAKTEKEKDRNLQRELKQMGIAADAAKSGATPDVKKQIDRDVKERAALLRQEENLMKESNPKRRDEGTLSHVRAQLRAVSTRLANAGMKGMEIPGEAKEPEAGGPKEGETKKNSKGLEVVYRNGQWQLP